MVRAVAAFTIVIAFVVIVWVARLAHLQMQAGAETSPQCITEDDREVIRYLALSAFDTAFSEQAVSLFKVWLRDPQKQPERAMVGMSNIIAVHNRARAQALAWNPPVCP